VTVTLVVTVVVPVAVVVLCGKRAAVGFAGSVVLLVAVSGAHG
jgi:hypothetical protein